MAFENIIGQYRQKDVVNRAIERNRLAHAYLFYGYEGVGKEAMALELAKAIICESSSRRPCGGCGSCHKMASLQHPDVHIIFPAPLSLKVEEEREVLESLIRNPYWRTHPWANPVISIARIRELRQASVLKSFEGQGRIFIIAEAEKMTVQAANALLKMLEEPPHGTMLVLTTAKLNLLLPTIVSRCQLIRFDLLRDEDIASALIERQNITANAARLISRVANGSYRQALELLDDDLNAHRDRIVDILRTVIRSDYERLLQVEELGNSADKRLIKEYLQLMLLWFRDVLLLSEFPEERGIEDKVVNFDRIDILRKFIKAFERIDFDLAVTEIENALRRIDRNIHTGLVLIILFQRLHTALRRKRDV